MAFPHPSWATLIVTFKVGVVTLIVVCRTFLSSFPLTLMIKEPLLCFNWHQLLPSWLTSAVQVSLVFIIISLLSSDSPKFTVFSFTSK